MAIAELHGPIKQLHGTVGGFTYVGLNGQQVIRHPQHPYKRKAGQNRQPQRLKAAVAYWRAVKRDPAQYAFYSSLPRVPGIGAYQKAVRDFLTPPEVREIDLAEYTGAKGEPIRILAHDDTAVVEVVVELRNMQGDLLEQGQAVAEGASNGWWQYHTANAVAAGQTVSIAVTAYDFAGNTGAKTLLAYGS